MALWLGAVALRVAAWARTGAISNDGPRYLEQAQAFGRGDWVGVCSESYHPLYAFAVWLVRSTGAFTDANSGGDSVWNLPQLGWGLPSLESAARAGAAPLGWDPSWEHAAVSVSIVAGATAAVFLVRLLRESFGGPVAWVGGTLLAVHSRAVEYSAEVQSDPLYLAFFVLALWWGWRALRDRSVAAAAIMGLASGVAYLARPEGLVVPTAGAAVVVLLVLRGLWPRRTALLWLTSAGAATLLCVLPYVVALRAVTGTWTLSQKKSITTFLGGGVPLPQGRHLMDADGALRWVSLAPLAPPPSRPRPALPARILASAVEVIETNRSSLRATILLLLAVGVAVSLGRPGLRAAWSVAPFAVATPLLLLLSLQAGYVSRRHALPPLIPLFGYAAVGAIAAGRAICTALWRVAGGDAGAAAGKIAPCLGTALAVALIAPYHFEIERSSRVAPRRAAEWLRLYAAPRAAADNLVAVETARGGYYSGLPAVSIGDAAPEELPTHLEERAIRYAVVTEEGYAMALLADPRFQSLYVHRALGNTARVFGRAQGRDGTSTHFTDAPGEVPEPRP